MRDEQADEKHAPAGAEPPPDPHPRRIATVENARTAPLTQEIPVSPDVTIGQFDNGLRYYIRQNHEPENRAQLRLVVRAGSIVEDDDQSQRTGIRAMATGLQSELREVLRE